MTSNESKPKRREPLSLPHASGSSSAELRKVPKCGMDLLPEGTRFGMLRHMIKSPLMVIIMVTVMVAIMAAIMMLR